MKVFVDGEVSLAAAKMFANESLDQNQRYPVDVTVSHNVFKAIIAGGLNVIQVSDKNFGECICVREARVLRNKIETDSNNRPRDNSVTLDLPVRHVLVKTRFMVPIEGSNTQYMLSFEPWEGAEQFQSLTEEELSAYMQ